jgi:hypothetical protein
MKNTCFIVFLFCSALLHSQEPSTFDSTATSETSKSVFDPQWGLSGDSLQKAPIALNTVFVDQHFPPFNIAQLLLIKNAISESHYNAKGAREDLENVEPKILFRNRDMVFDSEKDQEFQLKYGVTFVSPDELELAGQNKDQKGYNRVIFAYLDKKYGMKWRDELRKDAIGFELPGTIDDPVPQLEAALQVIHPSTHSYARFPAPTDPDEKHQLLLIKIVSVSLVILLILYLLFRRRNRKTFMD